MKQNGRGSWQSILLALNRSSMETSHFITHGHRTCSYTSTVHELNFHVRMIKNFRSVYTLHYVFSLRLHFSFTVGEFEHNSSGDGSTTMASLYVVLRSKCLLTKFGSHTLAVKQTLISFHIHSL